MNDQKHANEHARKKPYYKPQLIQVPLRPDEAVLGACKTTSGSTAGPGGSNCRIPVQCYALKS